MPDPTVVTSDSQVFDTTQLSHNFDFIVPTDAGDDLALVIFGHWRGASEMLDQSSASYDGVDAPRVAEAVDTVGELAYIHAHVLLDPPRGESLPVQIVSGSTSARRAVGGVVLVKNVSQTNPVGAVVEDDASLTAPNIFELALGSAAGRLVLAAVANRSPAHPSLDGLASGQNPLYTRNTTVTEAGVKGATDWLAGAELVEAEWELDNGTELNRIAGVMFELRGAADDELAPPTNVSAQLDPEDDTAALIDWTPASNHDVRLYRWDSVDESWKQGPTIAASEEPPYREDGLEPGVTYKWYAVHWDGEEESEPSNETDPLTIPTQPTFGLVFWSQVTLAASGLVPAVISLVEAVPGQVTISIDSYDPAASRHDMYRREGQSMGGNIATGELVEPAVNPDVDFVDDTVTPGVTYFYQLASFG